MKLEMSKISGTCQNRPKIWPVLNKAKRTPTFYRNGVLRVIQAEVERDS